jgi:hypothetical protein
MATTPTTSMEERASGWVAFAGVMLIISGALDIVSGLWALDHKGTVTDLLYENKLETWGWIYVIGGIVVVLAGFAVFGRAQWARWVGVLVAAVSIIVNMTWVFAYPIQSLILVMVGAMVLYALIVYGGRDTA